MKTILYNPIFINPQAYYVFPQLYDNVSYMTTTSYNGGTISRGLLQDTEYLVLGAAGFNIDLNRAHESSNCAIYYFALYNKSLTPEEIEVEKERLNEEWLKRKTE